jgi:hypothetical protein
MYVLLFCGVCTGVTLLSPGENPIALIIIIIIIIIIKRDKERRRRFMKTSEYCRWNVQKVTPIIIGATETMSKSFTKYTCSVAGSAV